MKIEINIDELVLTGLEVEDRYRIGNSLKRELARLIIECGVPPLITKSNATPYLDCGTFKVGNESNSMYLGSKLAKAVYGRIGQGLKG